MAAIHPQVHLNGTSRGHLIADRAVQWEAASHLLQVLCKTAPHSRDFYHVPFAWDRATEEHDRRLAMLNELLTDLESEHETLIQGAHDGSI